MISLVHRFLFIDSPIDLCCVVR